MDTQKSILDQQYKDPSEKRAVYVGNLPPGVTDDSIREIFSICGSVHAVKLIGKSALNVTTIYAFVEYDDPASAQSAIETFNGRTIFESPIKVNWAYQSTSSAIAREETSSHFTIFVGDLATEVNDHALKQAFSKFRSMSDARVMWDMTTGRSRGYGFVSFVQRIDAEKAIIEMSGTWLGSRTIRCNWANQKQISPTSPSTNIAAAPFDIAQQYAIVANQAPFHLTTIYVGNLAADTTEDDLSPLFSTYGDTCEIKMWSDRGFGFVNVGVHDLAALAIVQLQGVIVKGRPIKCSWQFKSESSGRQRARSVAASNSQVSDEYMTYGGYPATQAHNNLSNMIPRQISAPAQVMSPEQLLAIQVHQQQQALARISLQVASMTAQSNYQ